MSRFVFDNETSEEFSNLFSVARFSNPFTCSSNLVKYLV